MSKLIIDGDRVTIRGYRRQGRSPRRVLRALRQAYADQLLEQATVYRNQRRQMRSDWKTGSF